MERSIPLLVGTYRECSTTYSFSIAFNLLCAIDDLLALQRHLSTKSLRVLKKKNCTTWQRGTHVSGAGYEVQYRCPQASPSAASTQVSYTQKHHHVHTHCLQMLQQAKCTHVRVCTFTQVGTCSYVHIIVSVSMQVCTVHACMLCAHSHSIPPQSLVTRHARTCICCLCICCASYSLCWLFSLSSRDFTNV